MKKKNLKLASIDIDSMYTNIPTADIPQILEKLCTLHNVDSNIRQELHSITNLVIEQNYFKFKVTIYRQRTGLAMGSPASSVLSEPVLQYLENTDIYDILRANDITGYFRYCRNSSDRTEEAGTPLPVLVFVCKWCP
jgi:endoglucanase Acf2